jgi:hypothetical protein
MTERPSGQGRPEDWARGYSGEQYSGESYSGEPYYGAGSADQPAPRHGTPGTPNASYRGSAAPGADPGNWQATSTPSGDQGNWQATPTPGADQGSWQAGAAPAWQGSEAASWPAGGSKGFRAADSKGFLAALFDFSFTSFVTTKIIKALYVLIMILTVLSALSYTILAFKVSAAFGLITLIIGDPLFIIIVMAFWRLVLEFFVVVFRIAEDTRAMRERSDNSAGTPQR